MNKYEILSQIIEEQKAKYAGNADETGNIMDRVKESPTASESHSDTTRAQGGWLANSLNAKNTNLELQIKTAESYVLRDLDKVAVGSLVNVSSKMGSMWYFILPFFGGETTKSESEKIFVVNSQAPMAQTLLGKNEGNEFSFRNIDYKINKVQ